MVILVFISLILSNIADAVYFTMTDVRVTIPEDKRKFPPGNHPLVTFYTLGGDAARYSVVEGKNFIEVFPTTGDVMLKREFVESNWKGLDSVSAVLSAANIASENRTSLTLDILRVESFDCDYIIEDLCFWKSVQYRVAEGTKAATLLGSLASPYLAEMCSKYKITYNIASRKNQQKLAYFKLMANGNSTGLQTTQKIDREDIGIENREVEIVCTVEDPNGVTRNVTRNLLIEIMDLDDNPPVAQEGVISVSLESNVVEKGQQVEPQNLIFFDLDSPDVNHYSASILGDSLNILQAKCNKYENDRNGASKTAIHCKLEFTKNMHFTNWTYSVKLQLNDTSLINGIGLVTVPIHLHFRNETGHHPAEIKKLKLKLKQPEIYPTNTVRVFRTAGPLARITQPDPKHLKGATNFTIETERDGIDVFNVTFKGGILFVHDYEELRKAPEYLRLNISWLRNGKKEFDELEIHIIPEPKIETCKNLTGSLHNWSFCAEFETPEECLSPDACALSTGGSPSIVKRERDGEGPQRCMWRGDKKPSKEVTTLYATCTPDVQTCPDGKCDELEDLNDLICPQDCLKEKDFMTNFHQKPVRGIAKGSGVCSCSPLTCTCRPMKKNKNRKKQNEIAATTIATNLTNLNNTNWTSSPIAGLGIELARCGSACVLGIVAGILFLAGAVALIVICWKLDRVKKANCGNLSDESRELAAPLSEYVSRNNIVDPLPINFDMTTSLADTAILNIINKYAPDPKWEFPRNQLIIEQTLGEGEFGRVLRAKALNIAGQTGYTTVAVKTLKDDARETELNDLLSEYQLLKEVSHPNVIRLLGVCTAPGGPIYLIIEFAEHGSLRNYLRRSRHLKAECGRLPSSSVDENETHYDEPNVSQVTPKEILAFAWQIAKGMAYLSDIKLVHRDLAARNVLLAAEKICKISDFGLTRDIYEDDAYFKRSKGRVPVKWMAPESLADHVYTNKSDVWSFGILIWELVTLGATPYPGIAVQNLFHLLRQGYRMERPDNCSPTLYNVMRSCWHIESEQRPTFQELAALFEKMLGDEVEYLDLTNNAIHNRSYFCAPFEDNALNSAITVQCDEKSDIDPLNYLSKSQSYIKCGSSDKVQDILNDHDKNQNDINTQGYETPVKLPQKIQTPTNDSPQYYTDMAAGKK